MVNKVILVGRLGRDPELRSTQSGVQVCNFPLATDSGYGAKKKTDWHSVTVFGKQAENCKSYVKKGSLVYIEGRLTYDVWEQDGIRRSKPKIIANEVRFIETKSEIANESDPCRGPYTPPKNDDTFEGYEDYVLY